MGLQIIEVDDDGMAGERICPGDLVLVKEVASYSDGDVLALLHNDKQLVRRVQDNCIFITSDFGIALKEAAIIGKVVRCCIDF